MTRGRTGGSLAGGRHDGGADGAAGARQLHRRGWAGGVHRGAAAGQEGGGSGAAAAAAAAGLHRRCGSEAKEGGQHTAAGREPLRAGLPWPGRHLGGSSGALQACADARTPQSAHYGGRGARREGGQLGNQERNFIR